MFTYIIPIIRPFSVSNHCSLFFRISDIDFTIGQHNFGPRIESDCKQYAVEAQIMVGDVVVIKTRQRITYVAGKSPLDSWYDDDCQQLVVRPSAIE